MDNVTASKRLNSYDNTKFFLIWLVILGHFTEPFVDSSADYERIFLFIYMFHMPLFFFITGLFQKTYTEKRKLNVNRVLAFIAIGYVYKMINYLRDHLLGTPSEFHLLWEDGIPWFMFVTAFVMIIMYLLRDWKPGYVMVLSVLIACFAGLDSGIGDTLCLSRTIVYFPFYAAGYYLKPEQVTGFVKKTGIRILSVLFLIAVIVLLFLYLDWFSEMRHLFTGRNPYSDWALAHGSIALRLLCYLLTAGLCTAVLSLVPGVRIPLLTSCGSKTLQIYFWHRILVEILQKTGINEKIFACGKAGFVLFSVLALVLVLLLSARPFGFPAETILRRSYDTGAAQKKGVRR